MTEAVHFLTAFAQAVATMTLYREGHPARERVVDTAFQALLDLQARSPNPSFTFLGEEIICGKQPIRDLKQWDWGVRLSNAGIQRLEFEPDVERADFVLSLNRRGWLPCATGSVIHRVERVGAVLSRVIDRRSLRRPARTVAPRLQGPG